MRIDPHSRKTVETILGIARSRFFYIDLLKLEHDNFYIPLPGRSPVNILDEARASFINSKISRNSVKIRKLGGKKKCLLNEDELLENDSEDKVSDIGNLVSEVSDIVESIHRISGTEFTNADVEKMREMREEINEKSEQTKRLEARVGCLEKEIESTDTCSTGAIKIGLQYKRIERKLLIQVFEAQQLVEDSILSGVSPFLEVTMINARRGSRKGNSYRIGDTMMNLSLIHI